MWSPLRGRLTSPLFAADTRGGHYVEAATRGRQKIEADSTDLRWYFFSFCHVINVDVHISYGGWSALGRVRTNILWVHGLD